ncbi:lipid asymmetry maintenance protein MlaB [Streptosporangium sp. NPDC000509]|uniref:STAS domain-containing protein n=1 Tax=Streptosporangium sp. NPDC000509 TaxID=3366186 RepID=UPI00368E2B5B
MERKGYRYQNEKKYTGNIFHVSSFPHRVETPGFVGVYQASEGIDHMDVVQHRSAPAGARARQHRLPVSLAAGPRRTPDSGAVTVQEQVAGERWVEAVLYLDRMLRITYSLASPGGAVHLIGELDVTNTRAVARTLAQARDVEDTLTIDVGQLDFVDLAGLRMLTGLCYDGVAHLINVPPGMRRLLSLLDHADVLGEYVRMTAPGRRVEAACA